MHIHHVRQEVIWPRRSEYHVLTYAEEGFAPLNIHTRGTTITKNQLVEFASRVNDREEGGSLYPLAAVSAVPRSLIRDRQDSNALSLQIEDFFRTNVTSIRAKKVIFDFRTPKVPRFVVTAIHKAIACVEAELIEEVMILDDDAT